MARETRQKILNSADRLFYERGFEATSLADIADDVRISRGNFYYHFKTKDEILEAVIAQRAANTRAVLDSWELSAASPADAVRNFARMLIMNQTKIIAFGCPVGTLCNELAKLDHPAKMDAVGLFTLFRTWLARQFIKLGHEAEADALALHLLMRSQGVAALATAFRDADFIRREVTDMETWLATRTPASMPSHSSIAV
ncbi:MAG: TetR/AcrR family transcriptional regulator [Chitinophagaceae bacterium]|nr:MAG: TetR/AcrR family transcriptional regulator [Chitinophagaceae bacterium]